MCVWCELRVSLYTFVYCYFCFFYDTASTEIYTYLHTRSLHDALPICPVGNARCQIGKREQVQKHEAGPLPAVRLAPDDGDGGDALGREDRKSTRLNSSH